ncbi:MAG: hypothetical protein K8F25_17015 [Fimbriimonadaceae bacterium]|nr:hypothetical protein [Alphaproteobacteria bacterium]
MKIVADLSAASAPLRARGHWRPDRLFGSGVRGAWYDPSAPGTLWADIAGSVPATAGGAVARMDDMSGNGHHLIQATAAARPTYRTAGGLYWLDFDGVDDRLVATTWGFSASDEFLMAYGGVVSASAGRIVNLGSSNDDMWFTASSRWVGRFTSDFLDAAGYGFDLSAAHVGEYSLRGGQADLTHNGSVGPTATTTGKAVAFDNAVIGARQGGAGPLAMRLYGFAVVEGGADAAARARLRRFLAAKSGVTL